jgi:hypothetical protein
VPAEIPKVAVVVLAATATEAGTVKAPVALLINPTLAPPAGAAFDSVTVQVALLLEPSELGEHCNDVTVAGDCKETVVDETDPFSEAVSVAV